jgi:EAL domain-containing protein (putative c-di-GMP-specific phosphodiesterase class I)
MYRAKSTRRGSVELFDSAMRASAVARLQMETELRQAIDRHEFYNWYQSIVNLKTAQVRGFEALVRWRHRSRRLIEPGEFISIAEETGIIIPLGRQVLKQACRQLYAWQQLYASETPLMVSVNLSRKQLLQTDLISDIREELDDAGIDPSCLKLEITESMVMLNPEQAKTTLRELKALGVHIAMDDFGTGYSSLSYLHKLPLDALKVDRSFVSQIESDAEKLEIVRTIITLAHNLGLEVIAEGIETREQMFILRELGCELGQGYLFSRPLDADAATDLLIAEPVWQTA